jgi:uncharacterized membrane protein
MIILHKIREAELALSVVLGLIGAGAALLAGSVAGEADLPLARWVLLLAVPLVLAVLSIRSPAPPSDSAVAEVRPLLRSRRGGIMLICLVQALLIARVLEGSAHRALVLSDFLGPVMITVGAGLPGLERNRWAGIRLPWTLADAEVWRRSHQIGAILFICGGGLALLIPAMGLPLEAEKPLSLCVLGTVVAGCIISSWWISRRT